MKWTLPLSIGAVFAACLTYLHLVPAPKADSVACCASSCCENASACVDCPACCATTASCSAETFPCYVIRETNGGDSIKSFDVARHETIEDVLARASSTFDPAGKDVWISRLGEKAEGPEQILPVSFLDIGGGIDTVTNFEIIPFDRVFIRDQGQIEK